MKEIKFRAWDKKNNKMVEVSLLGLHTRFDNNPPVYGVWNTETDGGVAHYTDVELMQFTGLKDKNGKEIYEGDILDIDGWFRSNRIINRRRIVKFSGAMFNISNTKNVDVQDIITNLVSICEVIGNIYDNPDLLFNL